MQADIYNNKGEKQNSVELPTSVFDVDWNPDLVHQVVVAMQANKRSNIAHTKDRSEVRGGGKKPWRQKGTGRARHGSIRSPIWVGGGITFGPRSEKNFDKKINKKMKVKALLSTISKKHEENEILFAEELSLDTPNTKKAADFLKKIENATDKKVFSKSKNAACIFISEQNEALRKSFKNIENVYLEEIRNINPLLLLEYKYVIFLNADSAVNFLETKSELLKKPKAKETVA